MSELRRKPIRRSEPVPAADQPADEQFVAVNQQEGVAVVPVEALARARQAVLKDFQTDVDTVKREALHTQRRKLFEAVNLLASDDEAEIDQGLAMLIDFTITIKSEDFRLTELIGRGGFGFAFIAEIEDPSIQPEERLRVVVKLSRPFDRRQQFVQINEGDDDNTQSQKNNAAQKARMLMREAAILYTLSTANDDQEDILYTPEYLDAQFIPNPDNPDERIAALVMELVDGVSLDKVIASLENFIDEPEELLSIAIDLANAVANLHSRQIIHNDIKPANAMISVNGPTRLLDLGLASYEHPGFQSEQVVYKHDLKGKIRGTSAFLPLQYEEPSMSRDMYALGRTFQNLLFGDAFKTYLEMSTLIKKLDPALRELYNLTRDMTHPQVSQRPNIQDVINRLKQIQTEL